MIARCAVMAQVCSKPEVITRILSAVATTTGLSELIVELSPSWPSSFNPQHRTPPAVVKAHA